MIKGSALEHTYLLCSAYTSCTRDDDDDDLLDVERTVASSIYDDNYYGETKAAAVFLCEYCA